MDVGNRPATNGSVERLRALFGARSVALVGATDRSQWSVYAHANLRQHSPGVRVHLVHPSHRQVHGEPAVPSVAAIGEQVDLAYVMVPTSAALDVVAEVAEAGIRNVVLLTAGFAEAGPEGVELESRLLDLAAREALTVLGPNGNGFINLAAGVTPYGLPITAPLTAGPVGIVLQSGGLASAVLAGAQAGGAGVSLLVSTGNEAMVSADDVVRYLVEDEHTRVIAAFLESVRQPDEFREVAALALDAGKPIVVLKAGRSEAGARSALAHTGALAGDDRVIEGAFRQLGIVRVDSLEELLATAGYLGHHPQVKGRRMAAVTASGGACDLLADRAATEGLVLPEYPDDTLEELSRVLPPFSNPHNPLDVTGYVVVDPALGLDALDTVGKTAAGHFDFVLYATTVPPAAPPDPAPIERRMDALAAARRRLPVPLVLQSSLRMDLAPFVQDLLAERGLYVLPGIELGTRAIGHGARYHERRDRRLAEGAPVPAPPLAPPPGAVGIWPEHLVRQLLAEHGVPVAPALLATTAEEAAAIAADVGGPVAMKVASPQVPHKSDLDGVRLGVAPADAARTYQELAAAVAAASPVAALDGVLVGPMRPGGVELLVGVVTDPAWGKVLSLGVGGVWVELLGDVSLRVLPVDAAEVTAMLGELRAGALLHGARRARPADLDRVVDVVLRIARLAEGLGAALDALEINPLRVDGDEVEVLDALAAWRGAREDHPDEEPEHG